MSDVRTIRFQASDGSLGTLTVEVADVPPWKLVVSGGTLHGRSFEGRDLFESLIALRSELERAGCRLLCAGARIDAFPSSMSRSMGAARRVYITHLGRPATDTINIFDEAQPGSTGTVEQQKEFHKKWIRSLNKLR